MLNLVCDYVKGLLNFDETKIVIGRLNFEANDFNENFIVVDSLNMKPLGTTEKWNNDVMIYCTRISANITIDFLGNNSLQNASNFINLQSSQNASDLQNELNIGVFHSKSIKNLKEQVGLNYYMRYQIELVVMTTLETEVNTLNIESAQFELHNEKEVIEFTVPN
jgi:hypothetical protein